MSQFTDGKCLRCASFLSRPQNTYKATHHQRTHLTVFTASGYTCTMPSVAAHTGSEKSPPAGDTAPTIVTEPVRFGLPRHETCDATPPSLHGLGSAPN